MLRSLRDEAHCVSFHCEAPTASGTRPAIRPRRIPPALPADRRASPPIPRRPMHRLPFATSRASGLALPVSLLRPRTPRSPDAWDAQSSAPTRTTAGCKQSRMRSAIPAKSRSEMACNASGVRRRTSRRTHRSAHRRPRKGFRLPENLVSRHDEFDSRCRCVRSTRLGSLPASRLPCSADDGRRLTRPTVPTRRPPPLTLRRGRKNYRSSPALRRAQSCDH